MTSAVFPESSRSNPDFQYFIPNRPSRIRRLSVLARHNPVGVVALGIVVALGLLALFAPIKPYFKWYVSRSQRSTCAVA